MKTTLKLLRVAKILGHRLLRRSDYKRWTNAESLEVWWHSRTERIARLIPPSTRVIEFGAGHRQLEKFLDPSCLYIPSDLIDRGPGTIICDLNRRPLPDLHHLNADVAVFGGVLEYIRDLPSFIEWLSEQISLCIASYAYVPRTTSFIQKMREKRRRLYYGYLNDYTEAEFLSLFSRYGFVCTASDTWTSQRICLFANNRIILAPHAQEHSPSSAKARITRQRNNTLACKFPLSFAPWI